MTREWISVRLVVWYCYSLLAIAWKGTTREPSLTRLVRWCITGTSVSGHCRAKNSRSNKTSAYSDAVFRNRAMVEDRNCLSSQGPTRSLIIIIKKVATLHILFCLISIIVPVVLRMIQNQSNGPVMVPFHC